MFGKIALKAQDVEGWRRLIAAVLTHDGGNGYVPHGYAIVEREHAPLGIEQRFATVGFNVHGEAVNFESGNYDLTREDAYRDLADRIGALR